MISRDANGMPEVMRNAVEGGRRSGYLEKANRQSQPLATDQPRSVSEEIRIRETDASCSKHDRHRKPETARQKCYIYVIF